MHAPTAGNLLRRIVARQRQADAARIADLADAERVAVVAALERVSPRARIDVSVLITSVRTEVVKRAEAERAASCANPACAPARFEAWIRAQGWRPSLATARKCAAEPDEEPDNEDDDEQQPERRRGRVRRRRPRTYTEEPDAAEIAPPPADASTYSTASLRPCRRLFGSRAFGPDGALTPEPVDDFPPPWVLPPDPDEDDERDAA